MNIEKLFEKATREKFRFNFRGLCTVEDLWDIRLPDLDGIYKTLNAEAKLINEESLLKPADNHMNDTLRAKIEIVRYIVGVRLGEAESKIKEIENKKEIDKLTDILKSKQDEDLKNKSPEELINMINALKEK